MEEWRLPEISPEGFRHPADDAQGLAPPAPEAVLLDRTGEAVLLEAWTRAIGQPLPPPAEPDGAPHT